MWEIGQAPEVGIDPVTVMTVAAKAYQVINALVGGPNNLDLAKAEISQLHPALRQVKLATDQATDQAGATLTGATIADAPRLIRWDLIAGGVALAGAAGLTLYAGRRRRGR